MQSEAKYPHTNEEFYIKLDYKDSATKITNLKFKFKYMNAGGKYEKLQGRQYIPIEGGIREKIAQNKKPRNIISSRKPTQSMDNT